MGWGLQEIEEDNRTSQLWQKILNTQAICVTSFENVASSHLPNPQIYLLPLELIWYADDHNEPLV